MTTTTITAIKPPLSSTVSTITAITGALAVPAVTSTDSLPSLVAPTSKVKREYYWVPDAEAANCDLCNVEFTWCIRRVWYSIINIDVISIIVESVEDAFAPAVLHT